jgi:hypothetical protein
LICACLRPASPVRRTNQASPNTSIWPGPQQILLVLHRARKIHRPGRSVRVQSAGVVPCRFSGKQALLITAARISQGLHSSGDFRHPNRYRSVLNQCSAAPQHLKSFSTRGILSACSVSQERGPVGQCNPRPRSQRILPRLPAQRNTARARVTESQSQTRSPQTFAALQRSDARSNSLPLHPFPCSRSTRAKAAGSHPRQK